MARGRESVQTNTFLTEFEYFGGLMLYEKVFLPIWILGEHIMLASGGVKEVLYSNG